MKSPILCKKIIPPLELILRVNQRRQDSTKVARTIEATFVYIELLSTMLKQVNAIVDALSRVGVNQSIIKWIQLIVKPRVIHSTTRYNSTRYNSTMKKVRRGIAQGGIFSPVLWWLKSLWLKSYWNWRVLLSRHDVVLVTLSTGFCIQSIIASVLALRSGIPNQRLRSYARSMLDKENTNPIQHHRWERARSGHDYAWRYDRTETAIVSCDHEELFAIFCSSTQWRSGPEWLVSSPEDRHWANV